MQKKGRSYSGYFARYGGSDRVFKVTKNTKIHFHGANKMLYVGPRLKVKLDFNEQGGKAVKNGRYGYLSKLPQPKRAGYVFEGWYTKRDGEGSYIGMSRMNRNLVKGRTVYADWDKIEATDVDITLSIGSSMGWLPDNQTDNMCNQINGLLGTRYDCDEGFYTYGKATDITMHTKPTTAKKSWHVKYFTDTGSTSIAKHPTKADVYGSSTDINLPLASGDIMLLTCQASVGTHVETEHYLVVRR